MPSDLPDNNQWIYLERQRIGRSIRETRMHRNLTQEAVVLAVPMNRSHFQDIEAGRVNTTLDTLLRIARVLDVHVADLLRGSGD